MWVKICANTSLADAALAAELGADAVGFVFTASKRQVTAEQVAAITKHLPSSVEKVGVFDTADPDEIIEAVRAAKLTAVQLHSVFDPQLIVILHAALEGRVKIIQTVRCELDGVAGGDERFEEALTAVLLSQGIYAVLLDAAKAGASGGLGLAFDWEFVAPMVRSAYVRVAVTRGPATELPLPKLIIAGGLTPANVGEAIAAFEPWGVDVASGVEAAPGKKDTVRVRDFIVAARAAGALLMADATKVQ